MFNYMPLSAVIDERILCMHGGLSPKMKYLSDINGIIRPQDIPSIGILCDLLWADPEETISGFGKNDRGVSVVFGKDVVKDFCEKHDLDLICRAHQVV